MVPSAGRSRSETRTATPSRSTMQADELSSLGGPHRHARIDDGALVSGVRRGRPLTGRLPPLLREAFGGSTSLVDVGVVRDSRNLAVFPHADGSVAQLNLTAAADW